MEFCYVHLPVVDLNEGCPYCRIAELEQENEKLKMQTIHPEADALFKKYTEQYNQLKAENERLRVKYKEKEAECYRQGMQRAAEIAMSHSTGWNAAQAIRAEIEK